MTETLKVHKENSIRLGEIDSRAVKVGDMLTEIMALVKSLGRVDQEVFAISRTVKILDSRGQGVLLSHVWGTIDLY